MPVRSIRFHDISNNTFEINAEMISYRPVQAENSSSGFYSGGEPKEVQLDESTYNQIINFALELGVSVHLHQSKREMMTSRLFISLHDTEGKEERSYGYNLSSSALTRSFTDFLRRLLD